MTRLHCRRSLRRRRPQRLIAAPRRDQHSQHVQDQRRHDTEIFAFRVPSLRARDSVTFPARTYGNTRVDHRVVSLAVVLAAGIADRHRELLSLVGDFPDPPALLSPVGAVLVAHDEWQLDDMV